MSFQAMAWAIDKKLKTKEKFVLMMLCNYASNDKWDCYPSINTLMNNTGMSKNTVISALKSLEDQKVMTIQKRHIDGVNLPNVYRINKSWGGSSNCGGVVQEMNYGSSGDEPRVVQEMNYGSSGDEPNTIIKPINKPINEPKETLHVKDSFNKILLGYEFSDVILNSIGEFRDYCDSKGDSYKKKDLGWKKFFNLVEKYSRAYGDDAVVECIDLSIVSNWKTIFEPKNTATTQSNLKVGSVKKWNDLWLNVYNSDTFEKLTWDTIPEGGFKLTDFCFYFATPKGEVRKVFKDADAVYGHHKVSDAKQYKVGQL